MLAARTLLLAGLSTAALHDLRVEHLLAPTGVDVAEPRFSWLIDATGAPRGEAQKSYRIVVTDPAGSPVWSSGEVTSDKNYLVAYAGVPLKRSGFLIPLPALSCPASSHPNRATLAS